MILSHIRFWCLLLLAAVTVHALQPVSSAHARETGSAFDPQTIDVSTLRDNSEASEPSTVADALGQPASDPVTAMKPVFAMSRSAEPSHGVAGGIPPGWSRPNGWRGPSGARAPPQGAFRPIARMAHPRDR
jgi:hypothetical protein